jgi:hypothetical protein
MKETLRFIWQYKFKNLSPRSEIVRHELGYSGLVYEHVALTYECCNEISGSIKF